MHTKDTFEQIIDDELIYLDEFAFEQAKELDDKCVGLPEADFFKVGVKPKPKRSRSVGRMIFTDDSILLNFGEFKLGVNGVKEVGLENGVETFIEAIIRRDESGVRIVDKATGEDIGEDRLTSSERGDLLKFERELAEESEKGVISGIVRLVRSLIGSV